MLGFFSFLIVSVSVLETVFSFSVADSNCSMFSRAFSFNLLSLESESIAVRSAVSTGLRKYTEPSEFMIK